MLVQYPSQAAKAAQYGSERGCGTKSGKSEWFDKIATYTRLIHTTNCNPQIEPSAAAILTSAEQNGVAADFCRAVTVLQEGLALFGGQLRCWRLKTSQESQNAALQNSLQSSVC